MARCLINRPSPAWSGQCLSTAVLIVAIALLSFASGCVGQRVQVDQGEILLSTTPSESTDSAVAASGTLGLATGSSAGSARSASPSALQLRFALISSNKATVRATLGPYSSSQTVFHNRSLALLSTSSQPATLISSAAEAGRSPNLGALVSAHVVHNVVYRHSPQIRVVFHVSQRDAARSMCVTLHGQLADSRKAPLLAKCQPVKENSACMAELIVPADWWPPAWLDGGSAGGGSTPSALPGTANGASGSSHKSGKKGARPHVELSYATSDDANCHTSGALGLDPKTEASTVRESQRKHIGRVPLSPVHATYERIALKDSPVEVFLPETPLYPNNVLYAPVFVRPGVRQFTLGANLVGGVHVERLEPVARHVWKVAIETTGSKRIRIACSRIDSPTPSGTAGVTPSTSVGGSAVAAVIGAEHVFDVLLRVDPEPDISAEQTIEWVTEDRVEAISQLNVQKDKVQNILMITRSRDMINTAIITGSQVAQPVKLIMISEAGQMSDVTHKAACHSSDESVLKVSPSCTSVYLDGSEIRSSANVSIHIKYSGHMSESHFTVWTPETPFTISASDEKLSHIKQWHAPSVVTGMQPLHSWHRNAIPKDECKLRFQQSIVKVYTRFVSINHNSGRESYLLGKRRLLADVTDMVHIRSSNSHVASFIASNVLSGVHPGKADIQVVAPTTGKILATKSVRVTADKEVVTALSARVVSGLNLVVSPDTSEALPGNSASSTRGESSSHSERAIYVAKVSTEEKMTSRYQEAVLDITLRFSDGTEMPLENFAVTEYNISVESLDPNVVVVAPNQLGNSGAHPRIICVGQGSGDLLSVTLETSDLCVKRGGAIQDAAVYVSCMPANPDSYLYQDAQVPRKYSAAVTFELQPPQSHKSGAAGGGGGTHYLQAGHHLSHVAGGSPLQVGLYTLFGVFCMALLAFVASCSVFAVHIKNTRQQQSNKDNSQDWVWLSKETLEQAVRPKNVSKFANIVVNPMTDLENRNLGGFVCSDGFGANICQNGDYLRQQSQQQQQTDHIASAVGPVQQHQRNAQNGPRLTQSAETAPVPGRARPLFAGGGGHSDHVDLRNNNNNNNNFNMNNNVASATNNNFINNNNNEASIDLNRQQEGQVAAAAAAAGNCRRVSASRTDAGGVLSFNEVFGGGDSEPGHVNGQTGHGSGPGFRGHGGRSSSGAKSKSAASSPSADSGLVSGGASSSPSGSATSISSRDQHPRFQQQQQQHTLFDLSELTVRPNLLAEVDERLAASCTPSTAIATASNHQSHKQVSSAHHRTGFAETPLAAVSANRVAACGGNLLSSPATPASNGSSGIIVNPIGDELSSEGLTPPPVPPHRQPPASLTATAATHLDNESRQHQKPLHSRSGGSHHHQGRHHEAETAVADSRTHNLVAGGANTSNSDTLNWKRLERQYQNNREKLAEYLDSLQESIA